MSSAGQIVGGIVGAVVGFYVGGPVGALQGAALGASIGGVLDPPKGPTVEGPRLQDKGVQTSTYGTAMPRIYGTIGGAGNITQIENNQLKETVRKESSGGKGGGSSTTTKLYTYSATFQLSLCEGPIAGVRRIWCADKLIYNAGSDDLETIIASNHAADGFRIYLGTDDQMPDPRYEAEYGVGNVSAHRGEAYISFYDFDLSDYSNTLQAAQFKVEVVVAANFEGMREIIDVQSGISYSRSSDSGVGKPYIYKADGASFVSSSGYSYSHSSSGIGSFTGNAPIADRLPSNSGGKYYCGALSDNSFLWVKPTNLTYVDGADIGTSNDLIPKSLSATGINFSSKKIIGATVSGNGNYIVIAFCPDSSSITVGNISDVHVITSDFEHVASYVTSVPISVYDPIGMGRSAQYHFGASCLSNDANSIYFAHGAGDSQIERWDLSNGIMSLGVRVDDAFQSGGSFSYPSIIETSDVIYIAAGTGFYIWVNSELMLINNATLADIIDSECEISSLLNISDVDTTLLTDSVRGYRVNGGSLRAAIEPLQAAFPFDVRQHGYKIQFLPRGQSSIETIQWEDFGATDGDKSLDIIQQSREMDSQLPARTTIKYFDALREYAIAEQYSERLNTEAINRVDRQLPIVLTANEAAGVSEVLNFLPWLERTDASFTLPPTYRHLEAGDVITVQTQDAVYELRITEINEMPSGLLEVKARPNRATLYSSSASGSEGVPPSGTIGVGGISIFVPLDIPVVDETIQNAVGFIGVMTGFNTGWPGALAVRSNDGGQVWTELQAYSGKATIGVCRDSLSSSNGTMIDQNSITVDIFSGVIESITKDQMLSGVNYAAYGIDGRWEIVRFQNATLQIDGSYLVSSFVRGDRGTEWASGLHDIGDYFIILDDPDNAFIGSPVESIALERLYRGVTVGASIDSASDVPFTYEGVNLECLSPVYARGTRDGSSNFTGVFTRRSRLSSSWWTTGTEAPVGESTQAYEIDVMSGSTVARTISAITPTFSYSAADQTTDFGSPQASITFRIYQLSGTVGRGYPYEVTL